jgi:hypothetical protein
MSNREWATLLRDRTMNNLLRWFYIAEWSLEWEETGFAIKTRRLSTEDHHKGIFKSWHLHNCLRQVQADGDFILALGEEAWDGQSIFLASSEQVIMPKNRMLYQANSHYETSAS